MISCDPCNHGTVIEVSVIYLQTFPSFMEQPKSKRRCVEEAIQEVSMHIVAAISCGPYLASTRGS